jgi:hypothetical protein
MSASNTLARIRLHASAGQHTRRAQPALTTQSASLSPHALARTSLSCFRSEHGRQHGASLLLRSAAQRSQARRTCKRSPQRRRRRRREERISAGGAQTRTACETPPPPHPAGCWAFAPAASRTRARVSELCARPRRCDGGSGAPHIARSALPCASGESPPAPARTSRLPRDRALRYATPAGATTRCNFRLGASKLAGTSTFQQRASSPRR